MVKKFDYFGIFSVKYLIDRKSLFHFRLTFDQKWSINWFQRPFKVIIEPIFHHFCKTISKNGEIWPISKSFHVNLAFQVRFGTPQLQNPKYHIYGKITSWKSQNLIKTPKSLPLRILESVEGQERTFQKVYFFEKNNWFSQNFSKFLLTTNKIW